MIQITLRSEILIVPLIMASPLQNDRVLSHIYIVKTDTVKTPSI